MKILYVITKSEIGGAQMHVRQLIEHMTSKGHMVHVMSAPGGWLEYEAQKHGATFYPNPYFGNTLSPLRLLKAKKLIKKTVREIDPDLVSCHSSVAGLLTRMIIRKKVPTVFTAHSWAFTTGAPLWRKISASIAERCVARYANKIICVSEYDRQLALKYHIASEKTLVTIHNGVSAPPLREKRAHEQVRILSIGRLAYPKEYLLLISAFKALPPAIRAQAHLTIVGDGPLREMLVDQVGNTDGITLTGQKAPDETQALLQDSDIFILLSKHEGFPMTILEAMAAGLPVIASRVGGIPEQVSTSSGILTRNISTEIIKALTALVVDESKRRDMGIVAQQRAKMEFSEQWFLQKTEAVYVEVLSK